VLSIRNFTQDPRNDSIAHSFRWRWCDLAVNGLDQPNGSRLQLSTRGANGQMALDVRSVSGRFAVQALLQQMLEFRAIHK
jgi:hypothetical protein